MSIKEQSIDVVRIPKATIHALLQQTYPDEFGDKLAPDLVAYGPDEEDNSFTYFEFAEVTQTPEHSTKAKIILQAGGVLMLLKALVPALADKDISDLESYGDDPDDANIVLFTFRPS